MLIFFPYSFLPLYHYDTELLFNEKHEEFERKESSWSLYQIFPTQFFIFAISMLVENSSLVFQVQR